MSTSGRVLVADDEEVMRDVLSTLLASESYKVDLAENGSQALEMIRDKDYGVVLLDLMMPGVDGLEVLEELKKTENRPVAVVLTAFASIDKAVRATKLGAFDFITKPFKNDELLLAVKVKYIKVAAAKQSIPPVAITLAPTLSASPPIFGPRTPLIR